MRHSIFKAYQDTRHAGVTEASPVKLISLLLDECITCCYAAADACDRQQWATKGEMINKSLKILDLGLLQSLNYSQGGTVAPVLADVYHHCMDLLVQANVNNQSVPMRTSASMLQTLRSGWTAAEEFERQQRETYAKAS